MLGEVGLFVEQLDEEQVEHVGGELDVARDELVDAGEIGDRRADGGRGARRARRRRRPVGAAAESEPSEQGEDCGQGGSRRGWSAQRTLRGATVGH